jgi:hypothetical protein
MIETLKTEHSYRKTSLNKVHQATKPAQLLESKMIKVKSSAESLLTYLPRRDDHQA